MRITGFDVENFKGITKASIRFAEHDTARVHTLVGLNESGKTTFLEAIHAFSPDAETELVVKSATNPQQQRELRVPRGKISNFTGKVQTRAYILANNDDWKSFADLVASDLAITFENLNFPTSFTFARYDSYQTGDFKGSFFNYTIVWPLVKAAGSRKFRKITDEESGKVARLLHGFLPTVAYYPTFVFTFPEKIYLTDRDSSPLGLFYRQLFQDILDYDENKYTIQESIVARLHRKETAGLWEKWFNAFVGSNDEAKVKQVIARAEQAVTELVFSKWNEVFGENVGGKQIEIELQYDKGRNTKASTGLESPAEFHDAYVRFWIKEGANRYKVEDRSLGFRWFFSFLLFTQFRINRGKSKSTIFLFDEPASNLHAGAQKKLLESFPAIARDPHRLIYSTHSHYMIEPKWLEQASIVYNSSMSRIRTVIQESVTRDSDIDVNVTPYRQFVQTHPGSVSYFQPILDTLEVVPSHIDHNQAGLIVEGKGDFYYLTAAAKSLRRKAPTIFPARGSGTMGALVSLHRGWGLPVRVLFDKDQGGKDGRKKLVSEFALFEDELFTISDLDPALSRIEDMFSEGDRTKLLGEATKDDKVALLRRVQELLAAGEKLTFDKVSKERMGHVLDELHKRCPSAFKSS